MHPYPQVANYVSDVLPYSSLFNTHTVSEARRRKRLTREHSLLFINASRSASGGHGHDYFDIWSR